MTSELLLRRISIACALTRVETQEQATYGPDAFRTAFTADLVRSGTPNENGAFWEDSDLEYGLPSLPHTPVNDNHWTSDVCGVITDAEIIPLEDGTGKKIQVAGVLWDWVNPSLIGAALSFAKQDEAYVSMECIANRVQCTGPNGCGGTFPYMAQFNGDACNHILTRSSWRRLVDPVFQGMGLVLPPNTPAWSDATLAL